MILALSFRVSTMSANRLLTQRKAPPKRGAGQSLGTYRDFLECIGYLAGSLRFFRFRPFGRAVFCHHAQALSVRPGVNVL
jgi:hypothetical protein